MPTLGDTLALLLPHLPPALVSAEAAARLAQAGHLLPAALSRCLYVECHPATAGLADLIVDLERDLGGLVVAGGNPALALTTVQRAAPGWAPVIAFARAWTDARHPLHHHVTGAWLEMDLASSGQTIPAPSLFVDFGAHLARDASGAERLDVLLALLDILERPRSPSGAAALQAALAELPPAASLLYAGVMLGRRAAGVRLCIMGLARGELAAYLRAVRWPGDVDALCARMETLARGSAGAQEQPAVVHLDIGDTLHESIGLEYALARRPQLDGRIAESLLLDRLREWGLLTVAQAAALSGWCGVEVRQLPHELWPSVVVRRVNHVKLVLPGQAPVSLKLYLCAEVMARAALRAARLGEG